MRGASWVKPPRTGQVPAYRRGRGPRGEIGETFVNGGVCFAMVTGLLVAAVLLLVAASWAAYRHRQLVAWDRELLAAFAPGERRDLSRRLL